MAHIDKLKAIFESKGLSYTEIGEKIGKSSTTVKKKFYSDNVNTVIDFLMTLGLKVVDENGVDITTEEKIFQKTKGEDMILIGNRYFSKAELKELKEVINNIDNDKKED